MSLDLANELKTRVEHLVPRSQTIQWVNIASPQLDLLLVGDSFFHANTIQSIIKNKSCKFLRLVKEFSKAGKIFEETLYYPFKESYDLSIWLKQAFGSGVDQFSAQAETTQTQLKTSTDFTATVAELLNARNGFVKIYDQAGAIGIVDTRTERLWLNPERDYIAITPSFSQSYAKNADAAYAQQNFEVKDLRVWLWQIIFNSHAYQIDAVKETDCFKLNTWPQLKTRLERKETLKVSACFARGAKVQDVLKHVEINKQKLNQFLYTAQLLKMVERISPEQVKFTGTVASQAPQNESIFSGFLGKLRKKLGI